MTDRELLELAAKAACVTGYWAAPGEIGHIGTAAWGIVTYMAMGHVSFWNPLGDDGDALRLAVKMGIDVTVSGRHAAATSYINGPCFQEMVNGNRAAATRRAIVRAAADVGKEMP